MAGTPEIARMNGKKGGRPKGSTTRPKITDHMSMEAIQELAEKALKRAMDDEKPDNMLVRFILEQVYGKAPQSMDVTSGGQTINKVEVEVLHGNAKTKKH